MFNCGLSHFYETEKKTERQIICPLANETNKLQVVEANPGNLLHLSNNEMPTVDRGRKHNQKY